MLRKLLTKDDVDFEEVIINGEPVLKSGRTDVEVIKVSLPNVDHPYWTIVVKWEEFGNKERTVIATGQVGLIFSEKAKK